MMTFRNLALGATVAAAALLAASPANAAILLCYDTGSGLPECPASDSNVNVDDATGFIVGGHLNDNPAQLVTFTGTESLVGIGSGQASVGALDTLLDTAVTFALTGATFNSARFNLEPLSGNHPDDEATSLLISYIPTFGGSPIQYLLAGNGNNIYGIYGSAGEQIQSITFGPYTPAGNGIATIKQVRVGGVQADVVVTPFGGVPEPSTWALLLLGFGAVGATLRRSKATPADRRLRIA